MVTSAEILKASILIVDDQRGNIELIRRMLLGAGYSAIMSTMDPGEVCGLHETNRYDLILLDLNMPLLDGFQVMERLKVLDPDGYLPVLVVTAQAEFKLRALQVGAKDFISKPFDLAEVLARVHNMLEVRLLQAETKHYSQAMEAQNEALRKALENVKHLSGLLPICSWCKKIRDDQGYWNAIEHYLSQHSEAEFTHGICPDCRRKYSGELLNEDV